MMESMRRSAACLVIALFLWPGLAVRAQSDLHAPFDKLLDLYVRDGFVYYQALQKDRASIDRYVASLDIPRARIDAWPVKDQEAFWVNAYNAFVLRTVIDAYPLRVQRSPDFPTKSIRQIPGAFEQLKHRVGGQAMTLDDIEKNVIAKFGDARLLLALGRGAIGSGRLRSEAYQGSSLDQQLALVVKECATRVTCVKVDRDKNLLEVTPLVSWREEDFVQTFAAEGQKMWANRSPIERAVAAMAYPHLFFTEKEYLAANTFQMKYGTFDWRLNDLTGGVPE